MPIPPDCMFVRLNFDLYSSGAPVEHASVGFHGQRVHQSGNPTDWPADIQGLAEAIRDEWVADMTGYKGRVGPACHAVNVEAYHLATTGLTLDKGVAPFDGANAWQGSGNATTPFQCSTVLSMYAYQPGTFTQNGKYKRGRSYWLPPAPATLDDDGRLTTTNQSEQLTMFGGFFNDVQGTHIGGTAPVTDNDYFNLGLVSKTSGLFYPITYVGIGRVIDTQRRRRRSLDEARTWTTIAHS